MSGLSARAAQMLTVLITEEAMTGEAVGLDDRDLGALTGRAHSTHRPRSVQRALKELVDEGYIERVFAPDGTRLIRVLSDGD